MDDASTPLSAATVARKPHHAILFGVLIGATLGLAASALISAEVVARADVQVLIRWVTLPLGQVFLRLLFMLAVPLIFAALVTGVAELDPRTLGRVGVRTLAYTAVLSAIAVVLGLVMVNLIQPGTWNRAALAEQAAHMPDPGIKGADRPDLGSVVQMIPTNPIAAAATLPTTLRVAETELGLPRSVARFVLTAGASMNQNGSALFEGVTVLFLAQVFGVDLSLGQQLVIMLICILGGIGTAGIPGATLPVIAMMLDMVDVPAYGLALILGVDRVLDMCRTTVNVAGDLAIAVAVAGQGPPPDGDPAAV